MQLDNADGSSVVAASAAPAKRAGSELSAHSAKRQLTMRDALAASSNLTLHEQTALFFATNHIAYNVADSASFRSFCDTIRSTTAPPPHRRALKSAVASLAERLHTRVVQRITGGTAPVTVAIDGWTNVKQTKVTNLLLLCSGVAFYWCSIPNTYDANTAQWLEQQLTPHLQRLIALGIRFTALVADNESVNGALFARLQTPFPFLIRVPCAAHTIQLVVRQILQIDRFAATLATVASILSRFKKQKAERMRLRQLQQGEQREYSLLKPCDTRWNSQVRACERVLLLRNFITLINPQTADFWEALAGLIAYLLPFQAATDIVCERLDDSL